MENSRKTLLVISVLIILLFGATGAAAYFYWQFNDLKQNPQRFAQQEIQDLIAMVGKLIVLPEGEQPTIATVNDPELLRNQPFFAKAKKGDKVFIYTNARKAILYDPINNRIVEIAPISIGQPQPITP